VHDDDEKFDEFLRHAAKDYNAPRTPRSDAIWAAIEPEVARAIAPSRRAAWPRTVFLAASIAATLVVGVTIGRWSSTSSTASPSTASAAADSSASRRQGRAVTLAHLAEAEEFLTTVRYELESGVPDADRAARSRELLARTRVLLGTPRHRSPEVDRLLEDLELLLAEIAALPSARSSMDRQLLDESIRDGDVIPRIRATLPAHASGA
jgi:hypothetical protein